MKSKLNLTISIIALCVSLACIACCIVLMCGKDNSKPAAETPATTAPEETTAPKEEEKEEDLQYVLYLGTNDKDTNEPVYDPEEAKNVLKGILIEHLGGYTIQEANGGWIGDDGTEYQEYTLVIYLSDTDIDTVHTLCDVLIEKYNQSSVLIQMNKTTTEFYAGAAQ